MVTLTDVQRRAHSIPKGMDLLVTPEDFKRLVEFEDAAPMLEAPVRYEVEVIVATWQGREKTVTRSFRSKTRADEFCVELVKAGGKIVKEPVGVQDMNVNPMVGII